MVFHSDGGSGSGFSLGSGSGSGPGCGRGNGIDSGRGDGNCRGRSVGRGSISGHDGGRGCERRREEASTVRVTVEMAVAVEVAPAFLAVAGSMRRRSFG